jgi:hypothetical protein
MKKLKYYQEQDRIFYKLNLINDVKKCQDVYADLHFFEIYLTHNIDKEYSKYKDYGYENWKNDSQFWKNGNSFEYKQFIDNEKITLGFWVYLFRNKPSHYFKESSKKNAGKISLKNIFPGLTPKKLTHKIIHQDLQKIKNFRNVIFHFDIESFIFDKDNKPTGKRYIDEFEDYKKLVQEYTEALACDDIFINKINFDFSETLEYQEDIRYLSTLENISDFSLIHYNEVSFKINNKLIGCSIWHNDIYEECVDIASSMINQNKYDINICIFDYNFKNILRNPNLYKSKNKFVITLDDLPNLLNKIANDNAN